MNGNSYRSIMKGASVFGGVQVVQVLLNLVRGKFVAMFLGPDGMGISSLFSSSSLTLQKISSLGLNLALVKEVASAADDRVRMKEIMAVARVLITSSALLGAILCIGLAPWLSRLTFGGYGMTLPFMSLGVAVGFSVAFAGNVSVLQGLRRLKDISLCSIAGGITGVAAGVPLYYFFGTEGIVPAMGAMAFVMWIFSYISVRKMDAGRCVHFSLEAHRGVVFRLISLGILLMANELILSVVRYVVNIYINATGSTVDVGLYQAASSVTAQYSGMVFSAMAMDFFPRLSKAASDNRAMRGIVNRQNEITAIIMAPAVALLILTAPLLIRLLLTPEFLPVTPLMRWMGLGILFRALMVPMGYISFAKDNRKVFFWLEGVILNMLTLILSCTGYTIFGLAGLGYAFVADNLLCLLIYYAVNRRLYRYRLNRKAVTAMATAILLCAAVFASSLISSAICSYTLMSAIAFISILWSLLALRHRLSPRFKRK